MTHNICESRSLLKTKFSVKMLQVMPETYPDDETKNQAPVTLSGTGTHITQSCNLSFDHRSM